MIKTNMCHITAGKSITRKKTMAYGHYWVGFKALL